MSVKDKHRLNLTKNWPGSTRYCKRRSLPGSPVLHFLDWSYFRKRTIKRLLSWWFVQH